MVRLLLICFVVAWGTGPGLAQKKTIWSQDSTAYRAYINQAAKLGTTRRDSALLCAGKALQLAQQHRQISFEAESFSQIGNLSAAYADQVDNYYRALRIYEQLNNLTAIGETYLSLAETVRLHSNNKYPKEVLEYGQKAVAAFQKAQKPQMVLRANNLIGIYYAMTGQKDLAYRYFTEVRDGMVALKMDSSRIMALETNLANLQGGEEGLQRLLKVYAFNKRKDGFAGFSIVAGIAYSYRAFKRPQESIRFAKEGLQKAVELQNLGRQVSFHQYLHDGYKELRDFEQALSHADQVRILSDSLSKQQDAGRIAEAQQKYQNEKKQVEIEKQRRELLEKQLAIEQVETQKAVLDRELVLKTQRFAIEEAGQKLNEARFMNQSQQQQNRIQQLRVENLKKENEKQLLWENQRITRLWMWLGSIVVLIVFLVSVLLVRNRILRRKNTELQAAVLQGQTTERQRVAADLHDNLGTTLSALQWNLEAVDKSKMTSAEQAVYETIRQQVSQSYKEVRLLSHNLLPDELAKQGLAVALRILVDKMNRNTSVRFRLSDVKALPRLDRQTEFELYSICLELLNNTIKHAHATEGFIDLIQENGMVQLTIGDNGTGLDNHRTDGRGLQNIAARVAALSGTWTVESASGKGVENRIMVPIRTPARVSSQT